MNINVINWPEIEKWKKYWDFMKVSWNKVTTSEIERDDIDKWIGKILGSRKIGRCEIVKCKFCLGGEYAMEMKGLIIRMNWNKKIRKRMRRNKSIFIN
jgi:hypothetical protein